MNFDSRIARVLSTLLLTAALAACSSAPKNDGAYFQSDGPGRRAASEFENTPGVTPRDEKIVKASTRPYRISGKRYVPMKARQAFKQRGTASWYGKQFHGRKTAIGERYDMYGMSAAHPTLPLPSYVKVTNRDNGKSVVVRVNDRGPFLGGRIIDLSFAAAAKLGYIRKGTARVEIVVVDPVVVAQAATRTFDLKKHKLGSADTAKTIRGAKRVRISKRGQTSVVKKAVFLPVKLTPLAVAKAEVLPIVPVQVVPLGAVPAASGPLEVRIENIAAEGVRPAVAEPDQLAFQHNRRAESSRDPKQDRVEDLPRMLPKPDEVPTKLFLQLGAFGSAHAARRALNKASLYWLHQPVTVVAERGLHKLQAGPFITTGAAKVAAQRIRDESSLSPFYVYR